MAPQSKNWILPLILVAAGLAILFLSFKPNSPSSNKVTMQEVFDQKPAAVPVDGSAAKDPVPSPAIVTSPEHGQETGFAVQVYSFKDQQRAHAALADLKSNGYDAYIEISDLGAKGTWYRVRIGGLHNEAEAKAVLEKVKDLNKGILIIKPKR